MLLHRRVFLSKLLRGLALPGFRYEQLNMLFKLLNMVGRDGRNRVNYNNEFYRVLLPFMCSHSI